MPTITRTTLLIQLGNRIKLLRLSKELSQSQLSSICGIQKATISKIEKGTINASYITLHRFSEALEVSMKKIISD